MRNLSFIVATCIRENKHLILLKKCLESIVEYCNTYKHIYIINDSEEEYLQDIQCLVEKYKHVILKPSLNKGSADQQVFKVVLESEAQEDDLFFILQDSMFLNQPVDNVEEIHTLKFLWHFTNHRLEWNTIREPETEFNLTHNIQTHMELIRYNLSTYYNKDPLFLEYALNALNYPECWCGCFGNCCITTKKAIQYLHNKTQFADLFMVNTSNRERRMNESIFALICHYYLPDNYEHSFDGLYFDGKTVNTFFNTPFHIGDTDFLYCARNNYISKVSFCR